MSTPSLTPNPAPPGPIPPPRPTDLALQLAPVAASGHFDELRGGVVAGATDPDAAPALADKLAPEWAQFFGSLGSTGFAELNQRTASLARQIRDNGVSYNVYADSDSPQRPWSLDLFPLIISDESWRQIDTGVQQRVRVLDRVMADVYGPQELLKAGLLPPALVQGHPGYLRAMQGVAPAGDTHLHIAAFDLARGPDGNWWVVSQRMQAPSGLGYLLENRLTISRLFPNAFESMHVQRLAASYRAFIEGLKRMSPAGADAHVALLTPGPYNETYFEQAYLARYLGLTLVQGNDLTVRDQRLYLKTLQGLEPVHCLVKRLDDDWLDPLELRADSTLGIPGLLQVIRAGNVIMANAPGSAFLESSALLGFLPALARHLLGEELQLPALPTWWCGERAARDAALPLLDECVIKPTYPASPSHHSFEAARGKNLSVSQRDEWVGRIMRQGNAYTVQKALPMSQMPTWNADPQSPAIVPRSLMLRVFAVSDGPQSWRVIPGGLARLVSPKAGVASMQGGGSSADVWVQTQGVVDRTTLLQPHLSPASVAQHKRLITSRAAEHLFWLGRHTERTENSLRLARLTLESLNGEDQTSEAQVSWLASMAEYSQLIPPGVPATPMARRVLERALVANLRGDEGASSVGYSLRAIKLAAATVRERLSQEQWNVIVKAEDEFFSRSNDFSNEGYYSTMEALRVLESTSSYLAAMTGAQIDRMTRDDGWRLLSIGRQTERLSFLSSALISCFASGAAYDDGGFDALVALFDSTITFHAQYQQSRDVAALLDLLVLNRDNPHSLGWVALTLRGQLLKLATSTGDVLEPLAAMVPDPEQWVLETLCNADGDYPALGDLLQRCNDASSRVSDEISARYFSHVADLGHSLGA